MTGKQIFIPIDCEALKELIREVLREEFPNANQEKEAYSEKEFCELVGISRPTARRMRERGELKFKQVGRRVLYSPEHVRDFLQEHSTTRQK